MASLQKVIGRAAILALGLWSAQAFGQVNGSVSSIFNSRLANSLPHPDTVTASVSKAISQIADGAGWKTTIILANTDSVPASFTLNFWQGSGSPLSLSIGGQAQQQITGQIPVNGIVTIATDGSSPNLSTGWGQLVTSNSIGGTAIFRESVPGRQDTEAGVPLTPAASPTLLLPFDNTGPQTSAALVNPDPVNSAGIGVIIYDENGNALVNTTLNLPAMGQQPFSLATQYPATNGHRGVAVFSNPSGGPIVGLGLRFSGAPFTSIPMLIPGQTATGSASKAISQIADGAGWRTTIILANSDTAPANFTLNFWQGTGAPLSLSIGGQAMHQVTGQIPVNGIVTITTDGSSPNLSTGWGQLVTSNSIGGTAIFRESVPGRQDTEAGVPLTAAASPTWLLPFDNTGPQTSAALVNPDPSNSAAIGVIIYDENENALVNTTLNLPAMGQVPFSLATQFPATNGHKGLAVFSNPSGGPIVGLGLRFSGAPFTSIPLLIPGQ